ncbi:flagellar FliL protein [Desulfohalotomaculum tongense]|uniref:flagellar basal body-associated FliL family protein n=1 Tax=Desulforadius tongensis TaxID=1216062 RepID=UPI0019599CDF|nr:flagellar basal body-associated FliL family protein [Desulforadius tongensis]MBM7854218.1 flagellar FliL protein [Desulforadius tongensis]
MPKGNAEQGKKSNKIIIIALLALNLLIGGAVAGYFIFLKPSPGEPQPPKLTSAELGEMLVNLADPSGVHYLRFTAVMVYPEKEKELAEELNEKSHIIKHTVITLLRDKKLEDVQPPDSIEKVQREMTEAINKKLEHGKITRIYFTEYLTQ